MEKYKDLKHNVTGENILKDAPLLMKQKEFRLFWNHEENKKNKSYYVDPEERLAIIRYIVFLYDKESPLYDDFPDDLEKRKSAAAADSEMPTTGKIYTMILQAKHPTVNDMIIRYLIMQNNEVFKEKLITEQELEEFQRLRFIGIEAKTDKDLLQAAKYKDELLKSCKSRIEHLEDLNTQLYRDNDDIKELVQIFTPETARKLILANV